MWRAHTMRANSEVAYMSSVKRGAFQCVTNCRVAHKQFGGGQIGGGNLEYLKRMAGTVQWRHSSVLLMHPIRVFRRIHLVV